MSCEVCLEVPHKYKCPRCSLKTCSLACVNLHKEKKECSGKRDKTAFVAVKEFAESNLQSDYIYLEDVARTADNACRDPQQKHTKKSNSLSKLTSQARKRRVKLKIMPYPLSRRKQNTTYYNHKLKEIVWLTEWSFPSADAIYKQRFNENTLLSEALLTFIDAENSNAVIRHKLKEYVGRDLQKIHILLKLEEEPANSPRYHVLNLKASIKDSLCDKIVVEFPTFLAVLPEQLEKYTIVEPDATPSTSCSIGSEINTDDILPTSDNVILKPKPLHAKKDQEKQDSHEKEVIEKT